VDEDQRLTVGSEATAPHAASGLPAVRLTARGEIDAASAQVLSAAFDQVMADGAAVVVLDATDVDFLDSSGLRVIVTADNRLSDGGGQLFIEGMSGAVQRVLEISGLIERYRAADPG
jgi:anti-sigma B factor antagonist